MGYLWYVISGGGVISNIAAGKQRKTIGSPIVPIPSSRRLARAVVLVFMPDTFPISTK
jgi:hypothetical protein